MVVMRNRLLRLFGVQRTLHPTGTGVFWPGIRRDQRGYWFGKLFGSRRWVRLHRLVWTQAHGPIPDGNVIHHKDGNKNNNYPENLECLTRTEHFRHHVDNQCVWGWRNG